MHRRAVSLRTTSLRSYNEGGNSLPGVVTIGSPGGVETTYSFDYENVHFVILKEYYDSNSDIATDGDIPDQLYNWLIADKSILFFLFYSSLRT